MKTAIKEISKEIVETYQELDEETSNKVKQIKNKFLFLSLMTPVMVMWITSYLMYLIVARKMFKVGDLVLNDNGEIFIVLSDLIYLDLYSERRVGKTNKFYDFFGYKMYDTQRMCEFHMAANSLKKVK